MGIHLWVIDLLLAEEFQVDNVEHHQLQLMFLDEIYALIQRDTIRCKWKIIFLSF